MALGPNEPVTHAKLLEERIIVLEAGGDNGGITPAIINAKGDLIVGTGDNTPTVVSVGANGQILSADSSTPTGVKWIPAPSGGGTGAVSSVAGKTGAVTLVKGDVGLSSVDNTSDASKPVSAATQTALNGKADAAALTSHVDDMSNPHGVSKFQVGLGNVDNTSDANKPISTATQVALNTKASAAEVFDALSSKANTGDVNDALSGKESLANKNVPGGYVGLNLNGRIAASPLGQVPISLTDASSVVTDASLSNQFRVSLGGNRTLANPTNAFDGQLVMWSIKQDAVGSRTLTLGDKFRFGTDITSIVLSTGQGKTDKLGAQYNSGDDKWDVVSFVRGF